MKFLFKKQFRGATSYFIALAVILFSSTLVGGYSYIQAKQIQINADLLIAGEVRTNNLCIGGVCKPSWPTELLYTDVAAWGRMMQPVGSAICASVCQASGAGSNWLQYGGAQYSNIIEEDARNILNPQLTGTLTCIAGTGYNPDGTCKMNTYSYSYNYTCAPGWFTDTNGPLPNLVKYSGISSYYGNIQSAACKLPAPYPTPPPYSTPSSGDD